MLPASVFFFTQKTAYNMRISDWSSDVCSSDLGQWGLFTLQQLDFDRLKLEAGARFEHTSLSAKPLPGQPQFFAGDRSFDSFSGSLGASYRFADDWRFGVNVSRTERAPAAEELFANGPHAGTEAVEIGNPDFDLETAWSVEAVLRGQGTGYTFRSAEHTSETQ